MADVNFIIHCALALQGFDMINHTSTPQHGTFLTGRYHTAEYSQGRKWIWQFVAIRYQHTTPTIALDFTVRDVH